MSPFYLYYLIPLAVCVSLVYGATRHEELVPILRHAGNFCAWVLGFMLLIFVVISFLG